MVLYFYYFNDVLTYRKLCKYTVLMTKLTLILSIILLFSTFL